MALVLKLKKWERQERGWVHVILEDDTVKDDGDLQSMGHQVGTHQGQYLQTSLFAYNFMVLKDWSASIVGFITDHSEKNYLVCIYTGELHC